MNIKVLNLDNKDYSHTFRTLKPAQKIIESIGHSLGEDIHDPYYTIISQKDFVFPDLLLEESIEKGIEFVKKQGDVILYDSTDSTSLQGMIEVLEACDNVKCLVKHQLLADKTLYETPAPYGKWFFNNFDKSYCESGYNISDETWSKIHLSGLNIYWWLPPQAIKIKKNNRQVFGVFGTLNRENLRFGGDDAYFYNEHRRQAREALKGESYQALTEKQEYLVYLKQLASSEVAISPFGMGELCLRDVECWSYGTPIIKPDVSMISTLPNLWIKDYTYIACDQDFSNLDDKIEFLLSNEFARITLADNAQKLINSNYSFMIMGQWEKILS